MFMFFAKIVLKTTAQKYSIFLIYFNTHLTPKNSEKKTLEFDNVLIFGANNKF